MRGRAESNWLSSFSKQRGGLVWDEEIVWFPCEVCKNEALDSFCHLHLVAEPLNCEELSAIISDFVSKTRSQIAAGCNRGLVIISSGYRSAMKLIILHMLLITYLDSYIHALG